MDEGITAYPLANAHAKRLHLICHAAGLSQIRILASPAYLQPQGTPQGVEDLAHHQLLVFNALPKLNDWPIYDAFNNLFHAQTNIKADSGETLRQLALCGTGIVCLSDFMTQQDIKEGRLIELFASSTIKMQQPINLVYYKNRKLSQRVSSFIDFMKKEFGTSKPF
ncbi:LysR substrate-binding domain-containing protein [Psychrobacter raelei]|uniref:LysR substrate-binding domain-containing protein n=1 Tax=Psychrobacter raelei TaxID=2565531 RepID=A0AAT9PFZ2_9GAMM